MIIHLAPLPFCDGYRSGEVCARQNDEKLLATVTRCNVRLAQARAYRITNLPDRGITSGTSRHVVNDAELIDIQNDACERFVISLRALELLRKTRAQVAIVIKAGQLIVHTEPLELRALVRQVIVHALDAQHRSDACEQLLLIERLADIIVSADLKPL